MIAFADVAPRLSSIDADQHRILSRVESRGGWKPGELERFRSLGGEFDSLTKIAEVFVLLDDKHFSGRLAAAGVTVELADLSHDGADGSYFTAGAIIRLSRTVPPERVPATMLHEMAHAAARVIDGDDEPANSHGPRFRDWCGKLGESYGLPSPVSSDDAALWPSAGRDNRQEQLTAEERWQRAKDATLNPH